MEFRHDDQSITDVDRASKPDIFHAAEAEKVAGQQLILAGVETGQLSGTLTKDHSRHEGIFGHVAADPELICGDVLVTDDTVFNAIDVHYGRQLLHFEPLWICLANFIQGKYRSTLIERAEFI
jgi:hypothetical protein